MMNLVLAGVALLRSPIGCWAQTIDSRSPEKEENPLIPIYAARGNLRRRLQQIDTSLGDWRCLESPEYDSTVISGPANKISIEYHRDEFTHGDVCRSATTAQYFCPVSCSQMVGAPYCGRTTSLAQGGVAAPCRVTVGEAAHLRCIGSPEASVSQETKDTSILQKFEAASSHGDVCRDTKTDNYFCPLDCLHTNSVPFCYTASGPDGSVHPCRVDAATLDGVPILQLNGAAAPAPKNALAPVAVTSLASPAASAASPTAAGGLSSDGEMNWGAEVLRLTEMQREAAKKEDFRLIAVLQPQIEDARRHEQQQLQRQDEAAAKAAADVAAKAWETQAAAANTALVLPQAPPASSPPPPPPPPPPSTGARKKQKLDKLKEAQKQAGRNEDYSKVAQLQMRIDYLMELTDGQWESLMQEEDTDDDLSAIATVGGKEKKKKAAQTQQQQQQPPQETGTAVAAASTPPGSSSGASVSPRPSPSSKSAVYPPGRKSEPCTMHTYFASRPESESEAEGNAGLLARWRVAWESNGWKTRILDEDDAKAHKDYDELKAGFEVLPTVNPKEYELSCFLRHLAMAAVGGGWMTDYDVIPLALPACARLSNGGSYTTHEAFVPALVSATAAEYLRVTRLFANVPWRDYPDIFTYVGNPHVSDMLALQLLQAQGAIRTFPLPRCGIVEASDVFDGAGSIRCKMTCPAPPQPIDRDGGGMLASLGLGGNEHGDNTHGPLGAHFSHAAMDVLQRMAVAESEKSAEPNPDSWMPLDVLVGLLEMKSEKAQVSMHYVRGRMLEVAPSAYRSTCDAVVAPPSSSTGTAAAAAAAAAAASAAAPAAAVVPAGAATATSSSDVVASPLSPPFAPHGSSAGVVNFGENCHFDCVGVTGKCPQFCGSMGACCRQGFVDEANDPACGGGTVGCPYNHCCVRDVTLPPDATVAAGGRGQTLGASKLAPPTSTGAAGATAAIHAPLIPASNPVVTVSSAAAATASNPGGSGVTHYGENCHFDCVGVTGKCPQFCGSMGACCRKGFVDEVNDPACGGGSIGCDYNHCCVRSAVAL